LSSAKSERAIIVNPIRHAAAILAELGALLGEQPASTRPRVADAAEI
jgi:hypothetical protein